MDEEILNDIAELARQFNLEKDTLANYRATAKHYADQVASQKVIVDNLRAQIKAKLDLLREPAPPAPDGGV